MGSSGKGRQQQLGPTFAVIPDVQVKPTEDYSFLEAVGNYIRDKRPARLICVGDFSDVESLSSYSLGQASAECKRYVDDVEATKQAMNLLTKPWRNIKSYKPLMDFCEGNHEARIDREAEQNPRFKGALRISDLGYEAAGWRVHKFLKVLTVSGIDVSHYFVSANGRPISTAKGIMAARHRAAIAGHNQTTDMHFDRYTGLCSMIIGCCNEQRESYLTPQLNDYRRQIVMLYDVQTNGMFDPALISLRFLRARYS